MDLTTGLLRLEGIVPLVPCLPELLFQDMLQVHMNMQ